VARVPLAYGSRLAVVEAGEDAVVIAPPPPGEPIADVAAAVREVHADGVDAILDLVSPTPDTSLLNDGGRLASPLGAAGEGPGRFNVMAEPTPANLERLAELLETGTLRVPIQRSYWLEQAGKALQALPTTHTQGKLSLTIA